MQRYQAQLVIQRNYQVEGFDYNETFAPILKMTSVCCFIAAVVVKGQELHQLDVNNAFPHGDLEVEVYIRMHRRIECKGENKVWKLKKSLYGLCQALRQWFTKLSSKLFRYDFARSYANYSKGDFFVVVLVYVDDIVLANNDAKAFKQVKIYLNVCFSIKYLSPFFYFY